MLEKVDLSLAVSKEQYKKIITGLQTRLYELEHAVFQASIPVIVVFEGWAAAGKGSTISVLSKRLDPRGFRVVPVTPPRTAEISYPWLRRFWLKIPAYGQIVVFDSSWYRRVLIDRVQKWVKKAEWHAAFQDIGEFESLLAADGTTIVKFWLHISRKEQAKRFKKLMKSELTAWRVSEEDRTQHKKYDKYLVAVEEMLARTDTPQAPWVIVEATNRYHTRIKVMEEMIRIMTLALESPPGPSRLGHRAGRSTRRRRRRGRNVLEKLDLSLKIEREDYEARLKELQNRIALLGYQVYRQKKPVILVFEGPDASGKGGAIKRLTEHLDPRGFVVWPIAAPHGDDRDRHYLFRFWRRIPEDGQIAIFDRSWYGRVMVERVEGFCTEEAWMRAYSEINQFERLLVEHGIVIVKYYLYQSKQEQLNRFMDRKKTAHKSWKLTDEDWRNRGKWEDYQQAVEDMLLKTSTHLAPWVVVEAEDKLYARIKVLQTVAEQLQQVL